MLNTVLFKSLPIKRGVSVFYMCIAAIHKDEVLTRRFGLFEGQDFYACSDYRGDPRLRGLVREVVISVDRLKRRTA